MKCLGTQKSLQEPGGEYLRFKFFMSWYFLFCYSPYYIWDYTKDLGSPYSYIEVVCNDR